MIKNFNCVLLALFQQLILPNIDKYIPAQQRNIQAITIVTVDMIFPQNAIRARKIRPRTRLRLLAHASSYDIFSKKESCKD